MMTASSIDTVPSSIPLSQKKNLHLDLRKCVHMNNIPEKSEVNGGALMAKIDSISLKIDDIIAHFRIKTLYNLFDHSQSLEQSFSVKNKRNVPCSCSSDDEISQVRIEDDCPLFLPGKKIEKHDSIFESFSEVSPKSSVLEKGEKRNLRFENKLHDNNNLGSSGSKDDFDFD